MPPFHSTSFFRLKRLVVTVMTLAILVILSSVLISDVKAFGNEGRVDKLEVKVEKLEKDIDGLNAGVRLALIEQFIQEWRQERQSDRSFRYGLLASVIMLLLSNLAGWWKGMKKGE